MSFEVPALNPKSPSTSFKLRGQEFKVDLQTPLEGPNASDFSASPLLRLFVTKFNRMAFGLRMHRLKQRTAELCSWVGGHFLWNNGHRALALISKPPAPGEVSIAS